MCRSAMIAAALGLGVGAAALAGPLNKRWVAPGAAWVVHVDVEAVRGSTLGAFVTEHRTGLDLAGLDEFKSHTGLDPVRDIKSVTVYGSGPTPDECVAVIATTAAVDGALAKLMEKEPALTKTTEGEYTFYTWTEGGNTKYGSVRPGAGPDDRVVVAAPAKERLIAALRQIETPVPAAPGGGGEGVLAVPPRAGSMLYVSGTGLGKLRDPECSMMLQKMEAVRVDLGEAAGEVYAELAVTAPTSEDAANMHKLAQGAVAIAQMCAGDDKDLKPFMRAADWVTFAAEEKVVTARLKCSTKQLRELLDAAVESERATPDKTAGERHPRKKGATTPKEKETPSSAKGR